jgi:hypothetical protein
LHRWQANAANTRLVHGRLLYDGKPVVGARMQVDGYPLQQPTGTTGRFSYRVDTTLPRRHIVRVLGSGHATLGGRPLDAAQQQALAHATGAFDVGYRISDLRERSSGGRVVLTGRLSYSDGTPAPPVVLYTYRLSGTITDAAGRPVAGATVVTRTQDRDFWTFSTPSDAQGHYTSFFTASDEAGENPVPLTVEVASGATSYASPMGKTVAFAQLHSATMNVRLPGSPSAPLALPVPRSYPGAVYEGTLIGVSGPHGVVKPLAASWPNAEGAFRLVLPGSVRGQRLRVWEDHSTFFQSGAARPGGAIETSGWPAVLPAVVPRGLAVVGR